jgi:hypothetical protein
MNRSELKKAMRFVYRYQKLSLRADQYYEAIITHLQSLNASEAIVTRYRAFLQDGQLIIEELPAIDERQLEFQEMQNVFVLERR